MLWSVLLVLFLNVLITEITGFPSISELMRVAGRGDSIFNPQFNLVPFSGGFDISSVLNILCFIPLGVALPVMWPRFSGFMPVLVYAVSFSLVIEFGQMFTVVRLSDINDLLMNTLGVVIGWALAKLIFKWRVYPKNASRNIGWLIYPALSFFLCFIF